MNFPQPFYKWRPHPWHGLDVGPKPPFQVNAFIEICPFDLVKYEVDKETGYLRVDRPQASSSQHPTLYGFIPRTYCGKEVCKFMPDAKRGDHDPLDICVISERPIAKSEIILTARVIGGLPMRDNFEADDKIIAVLHNDPIYKSVNDITDLHPSVIQRLMHYFTTYKQLPGEPRDVKIDSPYGAERAGQIVKAAMQDYANEFGD